MTNFRRALLALITFITGVGLSLGIGAGIASAHHPVLEKTTARPCGAEASWTGTVTVRSDADYNKDWQNRYAVNAVPGGAYSAFVDDQTAFGPVAVGPYAATVASVTFNVESHWQDKVGTGGQVTTSGSIVLNRPAATTCPPVQTTPGVTFNDPSCANQNTASVTGQLNTDKVLYVQVGVVAPGGAVTIFATPKTGYTFVPNPTVFTHTFTGILDCTVHITAIVSFKDPTCANTSVAVIDADDTDKIDFTITGNIVPGGTVTVTAVAKAGFTLDGTKSWTHTFGNIPECSTTVEPVAPTVTRTEVCAVKDTFTAGPSVGVVYSITSGSLANAEVVQIIATPAAGYKFAGESQSITFVITGGVVEVCPVVTTTTVVVPPTTVVAPPACLYNSALLASDALCVPPTTALPRTGVDNGTLLLLGGILVASGMSIMAIRRKPKHA